mmetsp:Transcript_23240/g.54825  ORF Transcript_23240/g.54825 Transcript_23240/m.54825 type:complete len:264 (-) Transcript_23240:1563-2354(-)
MYRSVVHYLVGFGKCLERQLLSVSLIPNQFVVHNLGVVLVQHHLEFFGGNDFALQQGLREFLEKIHVLQQNLLGQQITVVHQSLDFFLDFLQLLVTPQRIRSSHHHHLHWGHSHFVNADGTNLVTHTPLGDHLVGNVSNLLDVVGGSCGNLVLSVDNFFGQSSSKGDSELGFEVLDAVHTGFQASLLRGEEGETSGSVGTGDDGNLLDLIVIGNEGSNNGVTSLVVSYHLLGLGLGVSSLLLETDHQTIDGAVNFVPSDGRLV